MTGENSDVAAPQPGNRKPAPGRLATLQAFVNTHYDFASGQGGEVLLSGGALKTWLAERVLIDDRQRLGHTDLDRALAVREGLRALAWANNGRDCDAQAVAEMRRASQGATSEIRLEAAGPEFLPRPGAGMDGAVGALLAIAAGAMLDGRWPHLKACQGRDCGWVFYDRSRNQSARWCAMNVCGDRAKARAYYRRQLTADD